MAVNSTDLKFYKSSASAQTAENTGGSSITSLGGAISGTEVTSGVLHELFDAVTADEAEFGRVEYRCIYVVNNNVTPQTLYDARVFVSSDTTSDDSLIEIGLDTAAVGADTAISLTDEIDSDDKLAAIVFSPAADYDNGLVIGDIVGNGGKKAVWVKRTINALAGAATENAVITIQGDTDF